MKMIIPFVLVLHCVAAAQTPPSRVVELSAADEACAEAIRRFEDSRSALMQRHPAVDAFVSAAEQAQQRPDELSHADKQKLTYYYAAALISLKQTHVEYLDAKADADEALDSYIDSLKSRQASIADALSKVDSKVQQHSANVARYREKMKDLERDLVSAKIASMDVDDKRNVQLFFQQASIEKRSRDRAASGRGRLENRGLLNQDRLAAADEMQFNNKFEGREIEFRLECIEEEIERIYQASSESFAKTTDAIQGNLQRSPINHVQIDSVLGYGMQLDAEDESIRGAGQRIDQHHSDEMVRLQKEFRSF